MLYLLQFLVRVFEVGAFVAIFFVVAFLLESEVVMGWAVQVRRLVKRHLARPPLARRASRTAAAAISFGSSALSRRCRSMATAGIPARVSVVAARLCPAAPVRSRR